MSTQEWIKLSRVLDFILKQAESSQELKKDIKLRVKKRKPKKVQTHEQLRLF